MGMRPLACMALFLAVLSLGATPLMAGESPMRGGTLRFAMIDTPPALDAHVLTATLSTTVSQHFLETLFAFTEKYEPVPHLAKSAEARDGEPGDGRTPGALRERTEVQGTVRPPASTADALH